MQSNSPPDSKCLVHEILINDFYDRQRFYTIRDHKDGKWSWEETVKVDRGKVLGFGVRFTRNGESQLAAYFSESRQDVEHAPDYKTSLWFFFESEIFDLQSTAVAVKFSSGIFDCVFSIARTTSREPITCRHQYRWPFYRQLLSRLFGDPFNFVSKDFFWEFKHLLKVYRPERLIN